jgi:hypothetical protein
MEAKKQSPALNNGQSTMDLGLMESADDSIDENDDFEEDIEDEEAVSLTETDS